MTFITRRQMLQRATLGFGSLAMMDLFARRSLAAGAAGLAASLPKPLLSARPLTGKVPHFPAKAKRVIYLFLDGGLSQVDSYDYKPLLQRDDGKPLPPSIAKPKFSFAP